MEYPGTGYTIQVMNMDLLKKENGQISKPVVVGIVVIVAIAFGSLGYALAPTSPTKEKAGKYIQNASEEEIKDLLNNVPSSLIKERAKQIYPIAIEDDLGRDVIIPSKPKSIVSLAPSVTETLYALGLGGKVIGVTEYCDYPPKVPELVEKGELETVGGFATTNVEKVVDLNPDLVIGTAGVQTDAIHSLEKADIPIVTLEGNNIQDVISDIKLVGRITGTSEVAQAIAENMSEKEENILEKVSQTTKRPKVFCEIGVNPIYTVAKGTFINEIINLAGGINIAENAESQYPIFSATKIVEANPDVFIIGVHGTELPLSSVEQVKNRFKTIDAAKNDRVYKLESQEINMLTRPGPRLVDALELMANMLHPNLN